MSIYFFLLLLKHSFADLWVQGRFGSKYGDKKNLTDLKLWVHSLDHAILTAVITLLFAGLWWAIIIAVLDFVFDFGFFNGMDSWTYLNQGLRAIPHIRYLVLGTGYGAK